MRLWRRRQWSGGLSRRGLGERHLRQYQSRSYGRGNSSAAGRLGSFHEFSDRSRHDNGGRPCTFQIGTSAE